MRKSGAVVFRARSCLSLLEQLNSEARDQILSSEIDIYLYRRWVNLEE